MNLCERYGRYLLRKSGQWWLAPFSLLLAVCLTISGVYYDDTLSMLADLQRDGMSPGWLPNVKTSVAVLATMLWCGALFFFQHWCMWKSLERDGSAKSQIY